jgi:acetyl esterase/lipase
LVERLEDAGTSVSLIVWPQMFHVFQAFPASVIPESDQSISGIGSFLADHLGLARATVDSNDPS